MYENVSGNLPTEVEYVTGGIKVSPQVSLYIGIFSMTSFRDVSERKNAGEKHFFYCAYIIVLSFGLV